MEKSIYRQFYTPEEVKEWAEINYGSFLGNTEAEIYKKVFQYTGSWYKSVNSLLRQAPPINTLEFDSWCPDYENKAQKMHESDVRAGLASPEFKLDGIDFIEFQSWAALKKADAKMINALLHEFRLTEGIIVYRLVDKDYLKNLSSTGKIKKNIIIKDKAFLSTSLLQSGTNSIKENYTYPCIKCALLKIRVPKASFGAYVSQDGYMGNVLHEYEFLLPPNTILQITKVHGLLYTVIECNAITE